MIKDWINSFFEMKLWIQIVIIVLITMGIHQWILH